MTSMSNDKNTLALLLLLSIAVLLQLTLLSTVTGTVVHTSTTKYRYGSKSNSRAAAASVDRMYIAFANDTSTEMSVLFHTPTLPSSYVPMVKYSTTPNLHLPGNNYTLVRGGESQTYHKPTGYTHHVVLRNLKPGTRYYYTAGNEQHGFYEQEATFITAPLAKSARSNNASYTMVIYGDLGIHNADNTITRVNSRIQSSLSKPNQYQMVFHVGDISYADVASTSEPKLEFEWVWNKWFDMIQPVAANAPYMVCPGNHEYNWPTKCPLYSFNFAVYNSVFRMPHHSIPKHMHNMWYSFDFAGIHFISISTETDYPKAPFPFPSVFGDQMTWFKQDLARAHANRQVNPWIVVVGHRPIYSSHNRFSNNSAPIADAKILQDSFEQLFHDYGVDMYIAGHVHSYERTKPVYKGKVYESTVNAEAPVYIVAGAAGGVEGLTPKSAYYKTTFSDHVYYSGYGYGLLSADYSSGDQSTVQLKWQYFRSKDDGLQDEVILTKNL